MGGVFLENHICLTDLLDQDISSYEYFNSLSEEMRRKIEHEDPTSFEEMQKIVAENSNYRKF